MMLVKLKKEFHPGNKKTISHFKVTLTEEMYCKTWHTTFKTSDPAPIFHVSSIRPREGGRRKAAIESTKQKDECSPLSYIAKRFNDSVIHNKLI